MNILWCLSIFCADLVIGQGKRRASFFVNCDDVFHAFFYVNLSDRINYILSKNIKIS
ncbi:hypothetical protein BLAT2472_60292 [Burkholderia latens]